jgi:hypothetical protein
MTTPSATSEPKPSSDGSSLHQDPEDTLVQRGVFSIDGLDGMTREQAIKTAEIALPLVRSSFAHARQLGLL